MKNIDIKQIYFALVTVVCLFTVAYSLVDALQWVAYQQFPDLAPPATVPGPEVGGKPTEMRNPLAPNIIASSTRLLIFTPLLALHGWWLWKARKGD